MVAAEAAWRAGAFIELLEGQDSSGLNQVRGERPLSGR